MATVRTTSAPTTITVTSTTTELSNAAGALRIRNAFTGFQQPSLRARAAHPVSGAPCDPVEDGAGANSTMIDWYGKGCYDPISKRVMFASTGANLNSPGNWVYNTQSIYTESSDSWSATRNFRGANEASNVPPIVHGYDNNCMDVAGRRFYKKKFARGTNSIMVFDLDTNAWINNLDGPTSETDYGANGGMDFVPVRGTQGALWYFAWRSADNLPHLTERQIGAGTWTTLIPGGSLGPAGSQSETGLSFNPRAYGGVGGVMLGAVNNAFIVRCDTLAVTAVSRPTSNPMHTPHDGHLCRDPAGPGWIYGGRDGRLYKCSDNGAWSDVGALPGPLSGGRADYVMVPIDAYGVAWFITSQYAGSTQGWLFRA